MKSGIMPQIAQSESIAPPDQFNPLKATDSELAKYGFPARPKDESELSEWNYLMSQAKYYVEPTQTPSQYTFASYSATWTGYMAEAENNKVSGIRPLYKYATATWIQPTYTGTTATPSFWVGIDGHNNDFVLQAGTAANATRMGGSTRYQFWVENYPLGIIWQATPVINAGNTVYTSVTYNGYTSRAFLQNVTTGFYTVVDFYSPYYVGDSVEMIHEAPGGIYSHWGSVLMKYCQIGYTIGSTYLSGGISSYSLTEIIMTTDGTFNGAIRAYPSAPPVQNNRFTIYSY